MIGRDALIYSLKWYFGFKDSGASCYLQLFDFFNNNMYYKKKVKSTYLPHIGLSSFEK